MSFPRYNNLDWLRLLFAAQVVVVHTLVHLRGDAPGWLAHFPGVPAFFFVSGLLIYSTYVASDGADYWRNRFLRLFPALLVVTLGGLSVVLAAHGWRDLMDRPALYGGWVLAQITLGQSYNPAHFRDVGVGVINGSLWTITTEILFYVCVPVIVYLERRSQWVVPALIAASLAIYSFGPALLSASFAGDRTLYDAVALTPIAWGWMFGLGIMVAKHYHNIAPVIRYLPLALIPLLGLILADVSGPLIGADGNRLGLVYFACYMALICWAAFGIPAVRLRPDFSYGTYVWHMPVINLLLVLSVPNPIPVAMVGTAIMAAASWYLVEKPSQRFKRRSLRTVEERPRSSAEELRPA
jgi:peptidoglycan/LPS O-acetylase OafA/YrhL